MLAPSWSGRTLSWPPRPNAQEEVCILKGRTRWTVSTKWFISLPFVETKREGPRDSGSLVIHLPHRMRCSMFLMVAGSAGGKPPPVA